MRGISHTIPRHATTMAPTAALIGHSLSGPGAEVAEVDSGDDGRSDRRGELLHGVERAARRARLLSRDVAHGLPTIRGDRLMAARWADGPSPSWK